MTRTSADRVPGRARRSSRGLPRPATPRARLGRAALAGGLSLVVIVSTASQPSPAALAVAFPAGSAHATTSASGTFPAAPPKEQAPLRPVAHVPAEAHAPATGPEGAALAQVRAVLEHAERRIEKQGRRADPRVVQAAGELGMLYSTFRAQQAAADRPHDDGRHAGGHAEAGRHDHGDPVELDDLVRAAKRLAGLLDRATRRGDDGGADRRSGALRTSVIDAVHRYAEEAARYANGRIPADVLCEPDFAAGHLLRCDAAAALEGLNRRFEKRFGKPIPITDSYRSYAAQVRLKKVKPYLAAVPGTSNHGWGLAVDLGAPINTGRSAEYRWLREHGPAYGWDNPSWARLDGVKPEPWHFEFFASAIVLGGLLGDATTAGDAARARDRRGDDDTKSSGAGEPARKDDADGRPARDTQRDDEDEASRPAEPDDAPSGGSGDGDTDGGADGTGPRDPGTAVGTPSPSPSPSPSPDPTPTDPTTTPSDDDATSDPTGSPTPEPSDEPTTGPTETASESPDEAAADTTTSSAGAGEITGG
ncbi:D-alanyl-D-alanine carboxypeptidase family protein [Myceligenerans pegani]|uniref:D-alanyl-D-alanine carboxypeptidase family protein n=1 Tax=Myceligenerans pegani TaxID=2776917 RepID=A0ABR9N3E1_9MICO|nr:D-alanyl-D-alanine carboxypeptidase family protein [Myceligenerans sp. TRM 65318]MBE1877644.1 D-alanyl-D-alanine carboxypeptidase family protein [Myceligenerans sp. TRM 65318]MBE3019915.1 D-alanyl-D-alanine carboxypeptidase family protein [Myceligenerans sp. TRM 65318]